MKRKISVRKVLQVLLGLVVTACCVTGLVSAANLEDKKALTAVDINITNGDKYHFLNDELIMDLAITGRHIDVQHEEIKKLDMEGIEHILMANPWVGNAQVYMDNKRVLHLDVTQRIPVARVFEDNGGSYYLDTSLREMPLSALYTYYTTVVTNVPGIHDDSTGKSIRGQIVALVRYVEQSSFWRAQIAQIAMDSNNTFQLIPVLGNHVILLGDTSDMKEKFDNLFLFYKKILNHIGWDKYERLDLRFKGQVVASPSLPWKGPVDKGMKTMSWYASIMDSVRNKRDDGGVSPVNTDNIQATSAKTEKLPVKTPAKVQPEKHKAPMEAKAKKPAPVKEQKEKKKEKYIYSNSKNTQSN